MTGMFLLTACEKSNIHKTSPAESTDLILPRSDCERCPEDECCCFIELQNTMETASITICGSTDHAGLCTGSSVGNCPSFSNGGISKFLDGDDPKLDFCLLEDDAFWILNTSSTQTANLNISCQGDEIVPQIIQVSIPPLTRYYYSADDSCFLTICQ
jgi:hypothetical protein